MEKPDSSILRVTYMEFRQSPPPLAPRFGPEHVVPENLPLAEYLVRHRRESRAAIHLYRVPSMEFLP